MFLEQQISILEQFLKDHVTSAENSALTSVKNYNLIYIKYFYFWFLFLISQMYYIFNEMVILRDFLKKQLHTFEW